MTGERAFTELRVVTSARWLADDLATAGVIPVVHDLGLDVPADTSGTAWWAPHRFVARLAATDVAQPALSSPGPRWLPRLAVAQPGLVRRRVHAHRLDDVAGCPLWEAGPLFAKAAEVKVDRLPAGVHASPGAFRSAALEAGLTDESVVQVSDQVQFTAEYRCFVAPGPSGRPVVVAASAYLVDGVTWDAWPSPEEAPDAVEAWRFAQEVVDVAPGPAGYVLDVGLLADGAWAVVEANASWSANPYHCDSAGVVASVLASQTSVQDWRWRWRSDRALDRRARPLPIRPSRG